MNEALSTAFRQGRLPKDASSELLREATDVVYLMLGRAISDWGEVERSLGRVFTKCFPLEHSAPAGHAFYVLRSTQTQIEMVARAVLVAAAAANEPNPLITKWTNLRNRMLAHTKKRNKLAHGIVVCERTSGEDFFFIGFEAFRNANRYNRVAAQIASKGKEFRPVKFTALDLHNIAADFETLSQDLKAFGRDLSTAIRR